MSALLLVAIIQDISINANGKNTWKDGNYGNI